jgi:HEPN domain-containing protein
VEKFLKALLVERGIAVQKTHDLQVLLDMLLSTDADLAPLRRALRTLTRHAVEYRYPGLRATSRQMQNALRQAERVRSAIRTRLVLTP